MPNLLPPGLRRVPFVSALAQHFALLCSDRENEDYGPYIEVEILDGWTADAALWGAPYVYRTLGVIEAHVIVTPLGDYSWFQPIFRLPETMRGDVQPGATIVNDWRGYTLGGLWVNADGYVFAVNGCV